MLCDTFTRKPAVQGIKKITKKQCELLRGFSVSQTAHITVSVKFNTWRHRAAEHLRSKLFLHPITVAWLNVGMCYFSTYLQSSNVDFVFFINCCLVHPPYPTSLLFRYLCCKRRFLMHLKRCGASQNARTFCWCRLDMWRSSCRLLVSLLYPVLGTYSCLLKLHHKQSHDFSLQLSP